MSEETGLVNLGNGSMPKMIVIDGFPKQDNTVTLNRASIYRAIKSLSRLTELEVMSIFRHVNNELKDEYTTISFQGSTNAFNIQDIAISYGWYEDMNYKDDRGIVQMQFIHL